MNKYYLNLFDSEGGDYVRAYSDLHGHEIYLYKEWRIECWIPACNPNPDSPKEKGFNIILIGGRQEIFVPVKNVEWYCSDCESSFPAKDNDPKQILCDCTLL